MDTVAILARTNRALRPFEEALSKENVRYFLLGRSGFWQQNEVKSVLNFLQCAIYPADYALAGAIRAPFHPSKFLPKTVLLKTLKDREGDVTFWSWLTGTPETLVEHKNLGAVRDFTSFIHGLSRYRSLPSQEAVRSVMGALKVGDEYADASDSPDNNPLENLQDLLQMSKRFASLKEFLDWTRRASAASKGKKGVALGTIHSSKGLEFSRVYLVSLNDGILPHSKSTDPAEESAIFFVGASRAERELTLTYSGIPSVFLKGMNHETSIPGDSGS